MKYSIDFHNSRISGWVESPSSVKSIKLSRSDGSFIQTIIQHRRPDVVNAGHTNDEICGFVFAEEIDPIKEDGNFLLVEIETQQNIYKKSLFVGDKKKWKEEFEKFQVVDRSDFSIQNGHAENLFAKNNDIIAFKLLLIRLRRGKRGFGGRISFVGKSYPEMERDWLVFKQFYSNNFSNLKNILFVRSLWSVLDTFSDFGTPIEKACGLSISNYLFQERFAQTLRTIYNFEEIEDKKLMGQSPYWGGMLSNQLSSDDSYDVFLTKNIEVLEMCPIVKKTFGVIFLESLNSELSIININQTHSKYFKEVFEHYKQYFEKYISREDL